jgi:hypothetical protein
VGHLVELRGGGENFINTLAIGLEDKLLMKRFCVAENRFC